MEHDIPVSQKDRQLPMIINLRGDEALVDEFNWDADQVMEFLGIKRSRLTQISGKELRVARIRRDRYLRPVYREADVRDYSEWTRATATHQSSSRAMEQAIDSLDDRFSDILVVLQEKLLQFEERSTDLLKSQLQKWNGADFGRFQELQLELETQLNLSERHERQQARLLDAMRRQTESLGSVKQELGDMRAFLGSFHQDLRALLVAQQALRRELDEAQSALHTRLDEQAVQTQKSFQSLEEALTALRNGQQQILQQTEKIAAPAEESSILQHRSQRPGPVHPRRLHSHKRATASRADETLPQPDAFRAESAREPSS